MKYRNNTQSMRRNIVKRALCGASLWVGYLGLGAGFLYLLLIRGRLHVSLTLASLGEGLLVYLDGCLEVV